MKAMPFFQDGYCFVWNFLNMVLWSKYFRIFFWN
jgi:hypothetical protein